MATGDFELDRDIICPCDYRDPDVLEYGACYCCLFVDKESHERRKTNPIPERRPKERQLASLEAFTSSGTTLEPSKAESKRELFYCRQCGYMVYRDEPPYVCPICKARREFFSRVPLKTG
jgi:ferredoxin-thioredoxin reductase catalytic chain